MADVVFRDRKNVLVGAPNVKVMGGVSIGAANPVKGSYPTDAVTDYKEALGLKAVGFIGEDGITKTVDRSTEKVKDANGDTVMVLQSDHSVTLKLVFLESANVEVLKVIAGESNVEAQAGAVKVKETSDELPHRCFAFDINGGNGARMRLFVPDGQVTEIGDVTFARSDVVKYEVTIECFPDHEDGKFYQFIQRATTAPAVAEATS